MGKVKTRFAPSPTGYLHVGGARTALFNFLLARKTGGTFQVRIEDTDRARHDESAIAKIADDLRWLGIEWDEGIQVGGPAGSYRQSDRLDLYRQHADRLLQAGNAYYAFETADELDALRRAAEARQETFRYARPLRLPTLQEAEQARSDGRCVVVRFLCPEGDVTVHDEVFGDVVTPGAEMDDFVLVKADGWPTYHLANVVDDATTGVTFIMRGQEFLGQTWRHVLLRQALGVPEPRYAHLPLILDRQGRKLSKRDGAVEVHAFRQAGYLPEVLVNFIALLGWRPADERERMMLAEMVQAFSVDRIGKSNARFDRDKLLAFNTDFVAQAPAERLLTGFVDYLSLNETPIPAGDEALLARLVRVNRGFRTFADIVTKTGVLFEPDDAFAYDDKAVAKVLAEGDGAGYAMLEALRPRLAGCPWTEPDLQRVIESVCAEKKVGMGQAAQPMRVAVTGTTISPAIYDTLLILGKARTLARVERCLAGRTER